jgi:hypothetical protein
MGEIYQFDSPDFIMESANRRYAENIIFDALEKDDRI